MLQQLHGVTMYSHDEHHTSAPYCWSERGKGASATKPSTAENYTSIRQSVCQSVLWPCFVQNVPASGRSCPRVELKWDDAISIQGSHVHH